MPPAIVAFFSQVDFTHNVYDVLYVILVHSFFRDESTRWPSQKSTTVRVFCNKYRQDDQLSQRDRAAGCVIVLAKSGRLELGDNILRTLYSLSSTTVI